jgi:uncharacterized protein YecE (DUF72 family)
MEFGKVNLTALNQIDFKLPSGNSDVLSGVNGAGNLYIGLPQWNNPGWVGSIYPRSAKNKDFLSFYVKHFNTIKLNPTHYNIQSPERIKQWREAAETVDFKFCPKMFKGVTHAGSVADKQKELNAFVESIRHFEDKLGPVFIQLSEYFPINKARELETLLKSLPGDITYFLEVRHPELFQNKNWFNWLQDLRIGTVITDTAGRRDAVHTNLTIAKAMIRFVANDHETDQYRMDEWIRQIADWQQQGIEEIYLFVHNPDERQAPQLLKYFNERLNKTK